MKAWLVDEQQQLIDQIAQQNLPHAMIVSGVKGSGKLELAQWLTQALLCQQNDLSLATENPLASSLPCQQCKPCNLYQQKTHPDQVNVALTGATIGVDQIRQVSCFFEKTAQLGLNQVVVIEDADKMTISAANALLKTLEEPTNNSFIILLVNDEQRLLPTIISRCRHIQIKPPIGEKLLQHIGQQSQDPFVNLSHLAELSEAKLFEQYQQINTNFISFLLEKHPRMDLTTQLINNEQSSRWLEKIIIDLLRSHHQWREFCLLEILTEVEFKYFLAEKKEALWQVYQLIKVYNKQSSSLTQYNKELGLEKLLVDIQFAMAE